MILYVCCELMPPLTSPTIRAIIIVRTHNQHLAPTVAVDSFRYFLRVDLLPWQLWMSKRSTYCFFSTAIIECGATPIKKQFCCIVGSSAPISVVDIIFYWMSACRDDGPLALEVQHLLCKKGHGWDPPCRPPSWLRAAVVSLALGFTASLICQYFSSFICGFRITWPISGLNNSWINQIVSELFSFNNLVCVHKAWQNITTPRRVRWHLLCTKFILSWQIYSSGLS